MTDAEAWQQFTNRPLIPLDEFYAGDTRRKTEGHQSFGFNWRDPSVTGEDTFCEVFWYRGTHEIAAVYSTFDRDRLRDLLGSASTAMSVVRLGAGVGPVAGPLIIDATSARSLGQWLGDRDLATNSVQLRLMGLLEHPLERYWVLRDAFLLETEPDGLLKLQERIDACSQGERRAVADEPWWEQLSEWLGGGRDRQAMEP